jgi:hypothetical protein
MDNTDLDHIEELAQEALATGWDRRLPQNCLDLINEVRYWRALAKQSLAALMVCRKCDYEVEVDPLELYRVSTHKLVRCMNCGGALHTRVSDRTAVA